MPDRDGNRTATDTVVDEGNAFLERHPDIQMECPNCPGQFRVPIDKDWDRPGGRIYCHTCKGVWIKQPDEGTEENEKNQTSQGARRGAMTFGDWLRTRRVGTSRNLRDVATEAGISPQYLCDMEQDRRAPSDAVLERLARTLQAPLPVAYWRAGRVPPSLRTCETDDLTLSAVIDVVQGLLGEGL